MGIPRVRPEQFGDLLRNTPNGRGSIPVHAWQRLGRFVKKLRRLYGVEQLLGESPGDTLHRIADSPLGLPEHHAIASAVDLLENMREQGEELPVSRTIRYVELAQGAADALWSMLYPIVNLAMATFPELVLDDEGRRPIIISDLPRGGVRVTLPTAPAERSPAATP